MLSRIYVVKDSVVLSRYNLEGKQGLMLLALLE